MSSAIHSPYAVTPTLDGFFFLFFSVFRIHQSNQIKTQDNTDPDKNEHQKDVEGATIHLFEQVIPKVARRVAEEFEKRKLSKKPASGSGHEAVKHAKRKLRAEVSSIVRTNGVNMRHLGRLRRKLPPGVVSDHVLSLAVMRTVKNMLNETFRSLDSQGDVLEDEPYFLLLVEHLNMICGKGGEARVREYWGRVEERLTEHFNLILTDEEISAGKQDESQAWWKKHVDANVVIIALSEHLSFQVNQTTLEAVASGFSQKNLFSCFVIFFFYQRWRGQV